MAEQLTLQIKHNFDSNNEWHDAAIIEFLEPLSAVGNSCALSYSNTYVLDNYHNFAETAVGVNLPVDMATFRSKHWFRFLQDIMPAGASRDYWITKLGLQELTFQQCNFELLKQGTIAPVGNVRIKESMPTPPKKALPVTFTIDDVCRLEIDFIEYAQELGAAAGGASGAGGAAPKLLLRCNDNNQVWIDTFQDDGHNLDTHYLVKFPRAKADIDKDILRAEYHFYQELTAMGFNTIAIDRMKLIESSRGPSLWLPRFDAYSVDGLMMLSGMESVYAILEEPPAKPLLHGDVIRRLIAAFKKDDFYGTTQTFLDKPNGQAEFVIEWVRRDLLNIIFGNSDNHGRNTAFIKRNNQIILAPIYDFAPMKADPELVTRTFTWGEGMERGGEYDFNAIAEHLSDLVSPQQLLACLNETALELADLKQRLNQRGVPSSILEYASIGYGAIQAKLSRWGLV
jgi:serine/threonine-protein kinase HipA